MPQSKLVSSPANTIKQELEVCDNTADVAISITESKARLAYKEFFSAPRKEDAWGYLGLAISCGVPIFTSTFNDIGDIKNSGMFLWSAFTLATAFFLYKALIAAKKYCATKDKFTADEFVKNMKGENTETENSMLH